MEKYNLILDQKEARNKVKDGINLAVGLVSKTLGAKSRRILIDKEYGDMDICDDGATILQEINVEDPQVGVGVKLVREASSKTNSDQGDGTTTTAVILRSLVNDLLREDSQEELLFKKTSGNNLKIRREIEGGLKKVLNYIDTNKTEISSEDQLAQVGRVSSNSEEIGEMLSEMFTKLGKDGAIAVSEGSSVSTEHEVVAGYSFDQGWLDLQFITDAEKEEAVLMGDPHSYVLVTSSKLQDIKHIEKLVELFKAGINDLLIIADDVTGIPLQSLVVNKMRQVVRVVAVRAPQLGSQNDTLLDICAATGATLIGGTDGVKFEELKAEHLGKVQKVIVSKNKTIIVGFDEDKKISERVKLLEGRLKREQSEYEKTKLKDRISKLTGGVGSIKVGGSTPLEIKDKKAKIVDAVAAVRSAMNGGIIDGGGVALMLASQQLDQKIPGELILCNAIQKPFEQIMENADIDSEKFRTKVLESKEGVNIETEEFGNMIKMGVIDPADVVKATVQNAVSSALMIANCGGAIVLCREKNKDKEE